VTDAQPTVNLIVEPGIYEIIPKVIAENAENPNSVSYSLIPISVSCFLIQLALNNPRLGKLSQQILRFHCRPKGYYI
jgi:hypothetical protein